MQRKKTTDRHKSMKAQNNFLGQNTQKVLTADNMCTLLKECIYDIKIERKQKQTDQ